MHQQQLFVKNRSLNQITVRTEQKEIHESNYSFDPLPLLKLLYSFLVKSL